MTLSLLSDSLSLRSLWKKLYHYIQSQQHCQAADAEDLTQEVFEHLLRKDGLIGMLERAESNDHFFNLLKRTAQRCMIDQHRREQAAKRRGWSDRVSLDVSAIDDLAICWEDPATESAYHELECLVTQSEETVHEEYHRNGKAALFENLRAYLSEAPQDSGYRTMAHKLETTEGALRCALFRMRRRHREVLGELLAEAA